VRIPSSTALTALTLIVSSALATAAEVRVLTVGSTQVAAKAIAADFEKQTRNQVTFTIRPPFNIKTPYRCPRVRYLALVDGRMAATSLPRPR